jgi:hypothetical protein
MGEQLVVVLKRANVGCRDMPFTAERLECAHDGDILALPASVSVVWVG